MKKQILIALSGCILLMQMISATAGQAKEDREDNLKTYAFRPKGGIAEMKISTGGAPIKEYFTVKVNERPKSDWTVQLGRKLKTEVNAGETCYISFYARSVKNLPGNQYARVTALVELARAPWHKLLLKKVKISPGWKKYVIPFQARRSWGENRKNHYAPGEAHVAFNFGAGKQKIEIGPVLFCNLGKNPDRSKIPFSEQSYKGREANAKWRQEAEKRINKLRKTSVTVNVTDANSKPVKGAKIKVKMLRHSFPFGACINLKQWKQQDADGKKYRDEFRKLFNMAVFEGAMKWRAGWDYTDSLKQCVVWLKQNNIAIRGHCLVWPSWKFSPPFLKKLENDHAGLRRIIRNHIYYVASMLKNNTVEWDVVNEVYTNNDLIKIFGRKVIIDWFKLAKEAAPNNRMYINDYNILSTADDAKDAQREAYFKLVRELKNGGAPIDGIGMQSHFYAPVPPQNMLTVLDKFASLGLELKITEYDFTTFNERLKADFTRDVLTVAFSHPAVNGFLMWGFWDGRHWNADAPVYFKNWKLKPSGKVYKELVFGRWWTNTAGATDNKGSFQFHGFKGKYEITVERDGKSRKFSRVLSNPVSKVKIKL